MNRRWVGFGATAVALALLTSACSGGGPADGGDGGWNDAGPGDCPDAGYCSVCHPMTACGEYPAGPYGMMDGLVLPPCFTGEGFWNPTGIWIDDGGNPKFAKGESFFADLYCSSKANPAQTYALVQVVITSESYGRQQASALNQCIDGMSEYWLASGGQVMQIIEQSDSYMAPTTSDLTTWVQQYGTNYSIAADTDQVLLDLMDATHGFPVTFIINLQTMVVMGARSYGGDFGQIQTDFTNVLDSGTF